LTTTVFYLTLTFFSTLGGSTIGATTIPGYYATYEDCVQAANQSKQYYTGGASIDYVCTAASKDNDV